MARSAHHWSRKLQALGHMVKLMPPSYVKGYLKRSKRIFECVLSIGTRSALSIRASGHHRPHQQAGHVTAPDQCCKNVRKFLPGRRPHVTQKRHGAWIVGHRPQARPAFREAPKIAILRLKLQVDPGISG
jgi:transposase